MEISSSANVACDPGTYCSAFSYFAASAGMLTGRNGFVVRSWLSPIMPSVVSLPSERICHPSGRPGGRLALEAEGGVRQHSEVCQVDAQTLGTEIVGGASREPARGGFGCYD